MLVNATGSAINLDATQVVAVAAFLRIINALENIRASIDLLDRARTSVISADDLLLDRAIHEAGDGTQVLSGGGLHPNAAASLDAAAELIRNAQSANQPDRRNEYIADATAALRTARNMLSDSATADRTNAGDSDD